MSENIEQKCGDVRDELLRDAISATQAWQSEAERKGKALAEVEKRIAKLEALLHSWNSEAANAGFAGSEYYNEPKNVFARVRQLKHSYGEAMKRRVLAERERDALAATIAYRRGCARCGGSGYLQGRPTICDGDSLDEITDSMLRARKPCECQQINPNAILEAHDSEVRRETLKRVKEVVLQQRPNKWETNAIVLAVWEAIEREFDLPVTGEGQAQ